MAVELDLRIRKDVSFDSLLDGAAKAMQAFLGELVPSLTVAAWRSEGDIGIPSFLRQVTSVRVRCGPSAEVEIGLYDGDFGDGPEPRAYVSFAPMRSPQSETLCVALAISLAELQEVPIGDDANMLGCGEVITPHRLLESWRVRLRGHPVDFLGAGTA